METDPKRRRAALALSVVVDVKKLELATMKASIAAMAGDAAEVMRRAIEAREALNKIDLSRLLDVAEELEGRSLPPGASGMMTSHAAWEADKKRDSAKAKAWRSWRERLGKES